MPRFLFRMRVRGDAVIRTIVNVTVMRKSASLPTSLHGRLSAPGIPLRSLRSASPFAVRKGTAGDHKGSPLRGGVAPHFSFGHFPRGAGATRPGFQRCSRDLTATRTSSTDIRPMGPDAYMEPKTTPPREIRSSVGCM